MKKPKKQSDPQAAATAREADEKTNDTPSKHSAETSVNANGDMDSSSGDERVQMPVSLEVSADVRTEVEYPDHRFSMVLPLGTNQEIGMLAEDIMLRGLHDPITLFQGMVLDGRRRKRACTIAGVTPRYVDLPPDIDPLAFVISRNVHRREIHDKGQRAAIAVDLEPMFQEEAEKRQILGLGPDGSGGRGRSKDGNLEAKVPQGSDEAVLKEEEAADCQRAKQTRDLVASIMGVSGRYVAHAKVVKNLRPDLFEKVKSGEVKLSKAIREVKPTHQSQAQRETPAQDEASDDVSPGAEDTHQEVLPHHHAPYQDGSFSHVESEEGDDSMDAAINDIAVLTDRIVKDARAVLRKYSNSTVRMATIITHLVSELEPLIAECATEPIKSDA